MTDRYIKLDRGYGTIYHDRERKIDLTVSKVLALLNQEVEYTADDDDSFLDDDSELMLGRVDMLIKENHYWTEDALTSVKNMVMDLRGMRSVLGIINRGIRDNRALLDNWLDMKGKGG